MVYESDYHWAFRRGFLKYCHLHNVYYDAHIQCPKCKRLSHKTTNKRGISVDIFANVIWLSEDDMKKGDKESM